MADLPSNVTLSIVTVITILYAAYSSSFLLLAESNTSQAFAQENREAQTSIQNLPEHTPEIKTVSEGNKNSSPSFILFNNQTGLINLALNSFWADEHVICNTDFQCGNSSSTGWKDSTSFEISTSNNTKNTWSMIHSQQISVKPNDFYQFVTHMKTNKWVLQSHILLEGFNETSNQWYQIKQCPSGINGSVEWQEFNCVIGIPENVTGIRLVLNAGWSSDAKEEASTWFDSIYLIKSNPFIFDPKLKAELVYDGLVSPTSMVFLDNHIIALEKNGTVQSIDYTKQEKKTLLKLEVLNNAPERGMLGSAISKDKTFFYLYYTSSTDAGIHNRIFKYDFVNNSLLNQKLLLDLPAGYQHNGGKILLGPDNYLYFTVGEAKNENLSRVTSTAVNYEGIDGSQPDGRAGILRVGLDGKSPTVSILGDKEPLNKYYAYGIRNSFGIDFDPLSGNLWDTENGPNFGDEINLVKPGFNSGWEKVQGFWTVPNRERVSEQVDNLTNFNGKGKYSSPEFTWNYTVGPTAIKFLSTDKLGKQYENDMFVADFNNGRIYHFQLNQNRTALLLEGPLSDKVADSDEELSNVIFAQGFGMITDLEIGPDGYLYILSYDQGKIYKIVPGQMNQNIVDYLDKIS